MISKKIEKDTHTAILTMLHRRSNNVAYLRLINEFSEFMKYNDFTYIEACHYFIDQYNQKESI